MLKRAFGELESQILSLFEGNKRLTVKAVHQALGGKDSYNTVMTVMTRLAEKKQLVRERIGLQYEYWLPEASGALSFLEKLRQRFSGFKTKTLVSYLMESADDLTKEDLDEMQKIVARMRKSKK